MLETVLRTKLHIPPARPNLVSRPRLIERLNESLLPSHKLTLVSAPAGFGKTTALSGWIQEAELSPYVSWLSLDERDNDPTRFLAYLIAALQSVESDLGQGLMAAIQSPEAINVEVVLLTLVNEASEYPNNLILILDDYHVIESPLIDQALHFLVEHSPPHMHLVISGRIDPSLPLSRLRASGQMLELRAHDLRFTSAEAAVFLNQAMGLKLSPQNIDALELRTEGWIAGLQLAALTIQGFDENRDIGGFVKKFTGSDRYVQDYLADEVLQQRPQGTREFLLKTSILSRLCAPLCDALVGQHNSRTILHELEAANLFITPLDNQRHWYRYHHLFADLLIHRLQQTYRDQIGTLHRRASTWYEEKGFIDEAVYHAQASGDQKRMTEILEKHWQEIIHRGEAAKLRSWLDALGPECTEQSAPLSMAYCWIDVLNGANEKIPDHLEIVKKAWNENAGTTDAQQPIRLAVIPSLTETLEATIALDQMQAAKAKAHARRAMALIPDAPNPAIRMLLQGAASYRLALAHRALGEYDQAVEILLEGLELLISSGNQFGAAASIFVLASIYHASGQIEEAVALCEKTLASINEHDWGKIAPTGIVYVILASLQTESAEFEEARKNLELGRGLAKQVISPHVLNLIATTEEKLNDAPPRSQALVEPLSAREIEVLSMIALGHSNREISEQLFLALDTVKGHNRKIYGKLGVKNRTQAVNKAISLEIISQS